jgi:23S rRNA (guanosine2251-2'-O)-methyltransferase
MTGRREPRRRRGGEAGIGGDQVEGRRAVLELLRAGRRRVRGLTIADGVDPSPILDDIFELAARRGVQARRVTAEELAGFARTDTAQGVLARADPVQAADLDELLADPSAFLVALDGVTDPRNVGAILRSAEGAGATGAVLPRHRSARLSPAAVKAAAGAVEHLPITTVSGIPATLERAARAGLWAVGLDETGDHELFGLEVADRPLVLVLGAEGRGLARLTRARCDVVARIPMLGSLASLNVAAAAALACFEVARRRAASH